MCACPTSSLREITGSGRVRLSRRAASSGWPAGPVAPLRCVQVPIFRSSRRKVDADRLGLGRPSCSGLSAEGGSGADRKRLWPAGSRGTNHCGTATTILAGIGERRRSRARFGGGVAETEHLRVLIANEKRDRLELLAQVVAGLGHEVIAREIYVKEVGAVTARERPDVALVGLGLSSVHALELISEIVREASCPVIALLSAKDPAYVHQAARRGVFAYIVDGDAAELQSAIDITLQRFAEYQSLQGAFGRRALIEQAKGILMSRHSIDADHAFDMLRDHSQHNGRKLVDVAQAIVDSHLLLLPSLPEPAATPEPGR